MADTKVKVAVRVRPMSRRGEQLSAGGSRGRGGAAAAGPGGGERGEPGAPAASPAPSRESPARRGSLTGDGAPALLSELELNTKCVVDMDGNQTVLHPPPANSKQGER